MNQNLINRKIRAREHLKLVAEELKEIAYLADEEANAMSDDLKMSAIGRSAKDAAFQLYQASVDAISITNDLMKP